MAIATRKTKRSARLNLRATAEQKRKFAVVADRLGVNTTDFILNCATARADEILTEASEFVLPHAKWSEFVAALERPVRAKPRLRKLLSEPSVLERR